MNWLQIPSGPPDWVRSCAQTVRTHIVWKLKYQRRTGTPVELHGKKYKSVKAAALGTGLKKWAIYRMVERGEATWTEKA